jgi:hypothetical protein
VLVAALAVTTSASTNAPLNGLRRVFMLCRSRMRSGAISMWRSPPRPRAFIQHLRKKLRE